MQTPTIIFRHRRENLKKCSLRGLENHPDFHFIPYPCKEMPPLHNYVLLTLDAPILSEADSSYGLCLVDATWAHAKTMLHVLDLKKICIPRSLPPHFRTAYPRRQTACSDPEKGLASIEALFIAFHLLKKETGYLLDHYRWKTSFLELNHLL